LGCGPVHSQ